MPFTIKIMSKSILVIDNDQSILSIFEFILSQNGITPLAAKSGSKGLEAFLTNKDIQLVFLDFHLKDVSGIEALKSMTKKRPNIPIILIAGQDFENIQKVGYESGAYGIIYKPFDIEEILKITKKILG
jgi:DNA-binding NtrC family response regulator